jgi:hypothetical protein
MSRWSRLLRLIVAALTLVIVLGGLTGCDENPLEDDGGSPWPIPSPPPPPPPW